MVVMTDDAELKKKVFEGLQKNGGYCPCMIEHIPENKCRCKEFRDMVRNDIFGECRCGLYINR